MSDAPLIRADESGLLCARGGFHIDPALPAECAVVTHAHTDHARKGSRLYVTARSAVPILRARLGRGIRVQALDYGERLRLGDVQVSLHPAGHVLGSAQVRVEAAGEVWVVTGDFKRDADPSCEPFEPVACDTLITEATFGRPEYRWKPAPEIVAAIRAWWQAGAGRPSLLYCYALGKTQRVLAELGRLTDRPIYLVGEALRMTAIYRRAGIPMAATAPFASVPRTQSLAGELIIAPPSATSLRHGRRLHDAQTAFVSGWMQDEARVRRYDAGFALSDHADWPQLVATVAESGARRVYVTHGQVQALAAHLRHTLGIEAGPCPGALN